MEVNDIELLSSALLSACESARSAGKSTIDTVSLFRDVNLKQIAKDLLQLISISTSISTLNPPRCIGKWKSNPAESGLPSLNTSLAACFTSLLEDDPETPEERIRQRFSYLFFYRMEHICNKHVTGDLMLARMIQLSGLEMNAGKILKHLRLFLDRGERFELLSDGLGGPGILFMLSENPEYLWWRMPKSTRPRAMQRRIAMINQLKLSGLTDQAEELGAYQVAQAVLEHSSTIFEQKLSSILGLNALYCDSRLSKKRLHTEMERSGLGIDAIGPNSGRTSKPRTECLSVGKSLIAPGAGVGAEYGSSREKIRVGITADADIGPHTVDRRDWQKVVMAEDIGTRTPAMVELFLYLLHCLGGTNIRRTILERALVPQGQTLDLCDAGLTKFVQLFSSACYLDGIIQLSIDGAFVTKAILEDGEEVFSLTANLDTSTLLPSDHLKRKSVLAFAASVCPADITERIVRKQLLPLLEFICNNVGASELLHLPTVMKQNLVNAFLTAMRLKSGPCQLILSDHSWFPDISPHLRAMAVYYRSVSLRSEGRHDESDMILVDMLHEIDRHGVLDDLRLHCALGRLRLSRTENAIMRKDFDAARHIILSWEARTSPPSQLELQVVRQKNTAISRIWRYTGRFDEARLSLEACLSGLPEVAPKAHLKFHLADVYCELNLPHQAIQLVVSDITELEERSLKLSKPFRRLSLTLAEAYLRAKEFHQAKATLDELLGIYESLSKPDVTDQLGHVRTLIGLARIYWYGKKWEEADIVLNNAMELAKRYVTFADGCFDIAFIHLFQSLVKKHLADHLLRFQRPRYYMAGTGTYVFEELYALVWPTRTGFR